MSWKVVALLLSIGLVDTALAGWRGETGLEGRFFLEEPLDPRQAGSGWSQHLSGEYYTSWDGGGQSFTFQPFVRLDQNDQERTHLDVREAVWIYVGDDWELRAGIDRVFWGSTEVLHLVDILNQTDYLEDPDGEEKLGQPLLKYSVVRDWGTLDAYWLPWFRERPFPGVEGRLRTQPRVDTAQARYTSNLKQHYPSVALRWSKTLANWDLGLAHFHGTSREPRFTLGLDAGGKLVLVPNYDIIDQTSIDVQMVSGAWLWKLEALRRSGGGMSHLATTGGFEYTAVGFADSSADLGLLMEWMWDGRGNSATTAFNHDIFAGLRWSANDAAGSEILGGVVWDWENGSRIYSLEANRRLGEDWKLSLRMRAWSHLAPADPAFAFRQDDYLEARLIRYF